MPDLLILTWVNPEGRDVVSVRLAFSGPVEAGQALADALEAIKERGISSELRAYPKRVGGTKEHAGL